MGETSAVLPVCQRQVGNPVLLARALFDAVSRLEGDQGARRLLSLVGDPAVLRVQVEDEGIFADADTAQALAALQATPG